MASRAHAIIPPDSADEGGAELKQIHQAVCNLDDSISRTAALPDSHLENVVKALTYPIIVTSPAGVVALANGPAKELLGTEMLSVGNWIYATVDSALNAAVDPYQPISATLDTPARQPLAATLVRLQYGGVLMHFSVGTASGASMLEYDLEVLDPLPDPGPIADDTPLAALPVPVLNSETTGPDVNDDRVVSHGAGRRPAVDEFTKILYTGRSPISLRCARGGGRREEPFHRAHAGGPGI